MISLDYSYRGFKTVLTGIKSKLVEGENKKEIRIILESDSLAKEYDPESVPTIRAIRQIFQGSKKIMAYIYLEDELYHDQILYEAEINPSTATNQKDSPSRLGEDFNPLVQQMKSILQASLEIQDIKSQSLISFYKEQDLSRAQMYKDRENMFLDLKTKEMELQIKQIESTSKKRSDIMESVLVGIGSGLKELIGFIKENPGDAAEIWNVIRAKKVE